MRLLLPQPRSLSPDDLHDLYDRAGDSLIRGGFVVSVDGGVCHAGGSRPLQSAADEASFHALRAVADAVVVGAGTARVEGYGPVRPRPAGIAWRTRHGRPAAPPLVIVSQSLNLDPGARCFSGPAVVVTCQTAAARRRDQLAEVATVLVAGHDRVDLAVAFQELRERGLTRLLCEGGPQLLTSLLTAGLLDELCLTLTPLLLGSAPQLLTEALGSPRRLELLHLIDGGGGVLLARYAVTAA